MKSLSVFLDLSTGPCRPKSRSGDLLRTSFDLDPERHDDLAVAHEGQGGLAPLSSQGQKTGDRRRRETKVDRNSCLPF
jgi:hypothetical protein